MPKFRVLWPNFHSLSLVHVQYKQTKYLHPEDWRQQKKRTQKHANAHTHLNTLYKNHIIARNKNVKNIASLMASTIQSTTLSLNSAAAYGQRKQEVTILTFTNGVCIIFHFFKITIWTFITSLSFVTSTTFTFAWAFSCSFSLQQ